MIAEKNNIIGKVYELMEDLIPRCCPHIIKKGTIVKITSQPSKNRIYIAIVKTGYGHKIKLSTLHRVGKEINENT